MLRSLHQRLYNMGSFAGSLGFLLTNHLLQPDENFLQAHQDDGLGKIWQFNSMLQYVVLGVLFYDVTVYTANRFFSSNTEQKLKAAEKEYALQEKLILKKNRLNIDIVNNFQRELSEPNESSLEKIKKQFDELDMHEKYGLIKLFLNHYLLQAEYDCSLNPRKKHQKLFDSKNQLDPVKCARKFSFAYGRGITEYLLAEKDKVEKTYPEIAAINLLEILPTELACLIGNKLDLRSAHAVTIAIPKKRA